MWITTVRLDTRIKKNQIKLFKLDNAESPEPEAHAHRWKASALTTAPALLPG